MRKVIYPHALSGNFLNTFHFPIVYLLLFLFLNYLQSKIRLSAILCKYYNCHFSRTDSPPRRNSPFPLTWILCLITQHPPFLSRHQVKGIKQNVSDQLMLKSFYITPDPHIFAHCFLKSFFILVYDFSSCMILRESTQWLNRMKYLSNHTL